MIVTDPEPYPVGYLQVDEVELEGKPGWVRPGEEELREMLDLDMGADGLDQLGREHLETLGRIEFSREGIDQDDMPEAPEAESSTSVRFSRQRRWFAASVDGRTLEDEDIGEEIRHCLESITSTPQVLPWSRADGSHFFSKVGTGGAIPPPSHRTCHPSHIHDVRFCACERGVHHILRHFPSESCHSGCALIAWTAGQARGHRL